MIKYKYSINITLPNLKLLKKTKTDLSYINNLKFHIIYTLLENNVFL
jgi:hypothetical protein